MCEAPEAFSSRRRKARKPHRCEECRRTIQPGDSYERASGIWEREPNSFATCLPCVGVREFVRSDLSYDDCLAFGGLLEHIENADFFFRGVHPDAAVIGHAAGLLMRSRIAQDDVDQRRLIEWRARRSA